MFLLRLAAAAAVALPLAIPTSGWAAGDVIVPAQRQVMQPLQQPGLMAVQKHAPPAVQKYAAPAVQKYVAPAVQKYAAPAVQKQVVLPTQKPFVSPIQQPFPPAMQKYAVQKHVVTAPLGKFPCQPKITYRHHGCQKRRHCCCCELPYQVVLPVVDPACGNLIQIPVNVPPQCVNVPWQKDRPGLFCRGVSIFEWPCGYRVKVVLLHKGDVVVHTFGQRVDPAAVPVAVPVSLPVEPPPIQPPPVEHSVYSPEPTPAVPPESGGPELVPPGGYAF